MMMMMRKKGGGGRRRGGRGFEGIEKKNSSGGKTGRSMKRMRKEGSNGHVWIGMQSEGYGAFFSFLCFSSQGRTLSVSRGRLRDTKFANLGADLKCAGRIVC